MGAHPHIVRGMNVPPRIVHYARLESQKRYPFCQTSVDVICIQHQESLNRASLPYSDI